MAQRNTFFDKFQAFTLAALLAGGVSARQATDCDLSFIVEQGCGTTGGHALVTGIEGGTWPMSISWSTGDVVQFVSGLGNGSYSVTLSDAAGCKAVRYFKVDCDHKKDDCRLRTQTMGGWGAKPAGKNPGRYMHDNFAGAFPGGLTIGCENTLTLSNAAAVTNFLPSGTTPRALNAGSLTDPGQTYRNVLAGQLVALTLSVGFDLHDPNFGAGASHLADAVIAAGPFHGWTVQELLDEANRFIGGCASSFDANQLNTALDMVNNNFSDGVNAGFVTCEIPKKKEEYKGIGSGTITNLSAFPNPANNTLNLVIHVTSDGNTRFTLMDALGRTALPSMITALVAGEQRTITLDVGTLPNGSYILIVEHNGERHMERVTITH